MGNEGTQRMGEQKEVGQAPWPKVASRPAPDLFSVGTIGAGFDLR